MGNKRFRDIFTEALERRRYRIQSRDFAHGNSTHNPHDLESRVDSPENQGFIRHVGTSGTYSTAALYLSLAAAALGLNCGEGGSPTGPTGKGNQVYSCQSSDGISLGQATFENVDLGLPMTVRLDDLRSRGCATEGYDSQFMVSRGPPSGEQLGAFESNTPNGRLTVVPNGNAKVVYLFPGGVDYGCLHATGFGQSLPRGRYVTVRLLKGGEPFPYNEVTVINNPEKEFWITNGLKMLNDTLNVQGSNGNVKYGSLTWDKNNAGANLAGGLAITSDPTYAGNHIGNKFVVFTNTVVTDEYGTAIAATEAIESYVDKDNMCGQPSSFSLFSSGKYTNFTPEGIARFRFITLFPR